MEKMLHYYLKKPEKFDNVLLQKMSINCYTFVLFFERNIEEKLN